VATSGPRPGPSGGELARAEERDERRAHDDGAVQVRPQDEEREREVDAARRLSALAHEEREEDDEQEL